MAKTPPSKTVTVHPITSPKMKTIASTAMQTPSKVSTKQVKELGASVMRHIEPRGGKIK